MAIWPLLLMAAAKVPVARAILIPVLKENTKAWPELFVPTTSPACLMPSAPSSPQGPGATESKRRMPRTRCADPSQSIGEQGSKQTTRNHERTLLKSEPK